MSNIGGTYNFVKLITWTVILELIFWAFFYIGHILIAHLKNEPLNQSFNTYEHPEYFWFFLLVPFLYFIYFANLSWKNKILGTYFSLRLQKLLFQIPSLAKSFWRFQLLKFALVFLVMGLANPQGAPKKIKVDISLGEIVVALDISRSMLVRDMDMNRSRLDAAKNGLSNLVKNVSGTSLSIVVFAGTAYPYLPMTRDLGAVSSYIQDISTDMISSQGTNIAEALDVSLRTFSLQSKRKIIYLITDGEDHEGGVDEAVQRALQRGASIHVIALGTEKGGPIPEPNGGVKRDSQNQIVISKPNFDLLESIAGQTGGLFVRETSAFPNFASIVDKTYIAEQEKTQQESTIRESHGNAYVLLSLLLLFAYMVLLEFNLPPKTISNEQ
jgi:Ca-activated chloride channel family protein